MKARGHHKTTAVPAGSQMELFYAIPGDIAPRDTQDLMAWPFFQSGQIEAGAPDRFSHG
jgi:plasmid replication initiation protein